MKKTLSLIFFLMAGGLAYLQIHKIKNYENKPIKEQLIRLWSQDIQSLENKLPSRWMNIKAIKYLNSDEQNFLQSLPLPITLKPNGKSTLEILMTSFKTKDSISFIIQHYLLDAKTQNLIFELDRTYKIKLPQKKPKNSEKK